MEHGFCDTKVLLHDLLRQLGVTKGGQVAHQDSQAHGEVFCGLACPELELLVLAACLLGGGPAESLVADLRCLDAAPGIPTLQEI